MTSVWLKLVPGLFKDSCWNEQVHIPFTGFVQVDISGSALG